jgi:hypothetical protein
MWFVAVGGFGSSNWLVESPWNLARKAIWTDWSYGWSKSLIRPWRPLRQIILIELAGWITLESGSERDLIGLKLWVIWITLLRPLIRLWRQLRQITLIELAAWITLESGSEGDLNGLKIWMIWITLLRPVTRLWRLLRQIILIELTCWITLEAGSEGDLNGLKSQMTFTAPSPLIKKVGIVIVLPRLIEFVLLETLLAYLPRCQIGRNRVGYYVML